MPTKALVLAPVATFMPSVDSRTEGATRVLDGRNFLADAKGPRSGFSSHMLSPHPMSLPLDTQCTEIEGRYYTFTGDAILAWRNLVPYTWEVLHGFTDSLSEAYRHPWSGIYVNGSVYLNHPYRGLYTSETTIDTLKLHLQRKTDSDIPGLIANIKDMAVVRGRPVLVNDTTIQWGAPGDMADFTPALGGAGGQPISNFTKGKAIGISEFGDGFIVWTTEGSIIAEYLPDSDVVWRFYPATHDERPLGPWAIKRLQTGLQVYLSSQGLRVLANREQAQNWTQEFNEYLRLYIKNRTVDLNLWRLAYDPDRELLFVLESNDGRIFSRAFVLSPTLSTWGQFNIPCYGMGRFAKGLFGYVDLEGIPHYFTDSLNIETAPANSDGLNRIMPRVQKQQSTPSSTAVCNNQDWVQELVLPDGDYPGVGWYEPGATLPASLTYGPLNAWVEMGYINMAPELESIDGEIEVTELALGTIASGPSGAVRDYTTQWDRSLFFQTEEDWNEDGSYVASAITEDLNTSTDAGIDFNAPDVIGDEDYLVRESRAYSFPLSDIEDWDGPLESDIEDWDAVSTRLSPRPMSVSWQVGQDGITFANISPVVSRFDVNKRSYALTASGVFHRLKVAADEVDGFFHVSYLGVTVNYGGQTL